MNRREMMAYLDLLEIGWDPRTWRQRLVDKLIWSWLPRWCSHCGMWLVPRRYVPNANGDIDWSRAYFCARNLRASGLHLKDRPEYRKRGN